MRYGADILFRTCLGVEVEWVEHVDLENEGHHFYTIVASTKSIQCPIHSLSFGDDETTRSSGVNWVEWKGFKFPGEVLGMTDLMFDPLAAAFFCCSRWEEIPSDGERDTVMRDTHGRFRGVSSAAYKEGMLRTPLIENLANILAKELDITPKISRQDYEYQPTIDIDIAYAYQGRSRLHNIAAGSRDFVLLRWGRVRERMNVLLNRAHDPYDSYDFFLNLHVHSHLTTKCFVHFADYKRPYDLGVSKSALLPLINKLSSQATVNWHPSYHAISHRGQTFLNEKRSFEDVGNTSEIRTHFLRGQSSMWTAFQDASIQHDYSMGYADQPGFRAGLSRPFPAYNIEKDTPLELVIHPFAVMDSTLKSYLKLDCEQSLDLVSELSDAVREVGGVMVTVWHNTSVSNHGIWEGWQTLYKDVVRRCLP
ncbi:MAG: hypothetical protein CL831_08075 [Crocinitomicaceae bacterium]|nr:hypothetical protein [Crocinitomicaceae bacterium]